MATDLGKMGIPTLLATLAKFTGGQPDAKFTPFEGIIGRIKEMGAFFALLQKILAVAPTAVATAEATGLLLAPGQQTGVSKKQAVLNTVLAGVGIAEKLDPAIAPDVELVKLGVGSIVDGIVHIMNGHKKPAAPAATPPAA